MMIQSTYFCTKFIGRSISIFQVAIYSSSHWMRFSLLFVSKKWIKIVRRKWIISYTLTCYSQNYALKYDIFSFLIHSINLFIHYNFSASKWLNDSDLMLCVRLEIEVRWNWIFTKKERKRKTSNDVAFRRKLCRQMCGDVCTNRIARMTQASVGRQHEKQKNRRNTKTRWEILYQTNFRV